MKKKEQNISKNVFSVNLQLHYKYNLISSNVEIVLRPRTLVSNILF
jgi:hypothetical protein